MSIFDCTERDSNPWSVDGSHHVTSWMSRLMGKEFPKLYDEQLQIRFGYWLDDRGFDYRQRQTIYSPLLLPNQLWGLPSLPPKR
jgi:hypothetical protein